MDPLRPAPPRPVPPATAIDKDTPGCAALLHHKPKATPSSMGTVAVFADCTNGMPNREEPEGSRPSVNSIGDKRAREAVIDSQMDYKGSGNVQTIGTGDDSEVEEALSATKGPPSKKRKKAAKNAKKEPEWRLKKQKEIENLDELWTWDSTKLQKMTVKKGESVIIEDVGADFHTEGFGIPEKTFTVRANQDATIYDAVASLRMHLHDYVKEHGGKTIRYCHIEGVRKTEIGYVIDWGT